MTVAEQQAPEAPLSTVAMTRRLFTVEEFERMVEVGIFTEDDRVELIEGEIIEMAAKNDPHVLCLMRCVRLFNAHVKGDLWLAIQDPIRLTGRSKPAPDLLVCRIAEDATLTAPTAANTLLVVEVADSSLATDRNRKLPLYAKAGIPEAWLFDLVNKRIERHTQPHPDGYGQITVARRGESVESLVVPGLVVAVNVVLGL